MLNRIIKQQQEERDTLLSQQYINRIDDRQKADYLATNLIKLITGPRRAGKSVLALQLLTGLNFAYLNFDDDLLLKHFEEDVVFQTIHEVYPGFGYLLLDEIQNLPDWELWVNKLYRRGINLVITGSNARLLSHELATSLTGRYLPITVLPFGFSEFIEFHRQPLPDTREILTPARLGGLLGLLALYLTNGGFPETVLNPAILKNYLSSLFDSVLLKDIVKRFRIRQSQQLFDLSNYLLSNYTNPYSANQLKAELNFNSVATVQKFIGYLEEPYLFFNLTRYNNKIRAQQKSPSKIYIVDNGLIKTRSFELTPNYGRLLENLVFIELLRRNFRPGLELFYYRSRNNKEIDFLVRKGHTVAQLIQVCYDITQTKTLNRETAALSEAARELACADLLLINWDKEEIIEKDGVRIQLLPAYHWLLDLNCEIAG